MSRFPFLRDGGDHLDLILATSEIGIWELDVRTGKALRNLRHDQIFGHQEILEDWSAEIFLGYVLKEDRKRIEDLLTASLRDSSAWSFEARIRRADGAVRWIRAKGMPKFSESGEMTKLIGHVVDITETKQNEDRLKLLTKELNHRVGNTFAIMNSVIRHTAKKTTDVDEFAETLIERLAALSRANRILISEDAERYNLHEIIDLALQAFGGWQDRFAIGGNTNVWFSGKASEGVSLVLHELLTNAVKHGALSVPAGRIFLDVETDGSGQVRIRWTETDGPTIALKRSEGIGTTILHSAMRNEGKVEVDFARSGLTCLITVFNSFVRHAAETPNTSFGAAPLTSPIKPTGTFSGQRVMVVEDDPIIGMDLSDILQSRGAEVAGPFTTVADALSALHDTPDAAVLDLNLGQETSSAIAQELRDRAIPFMILSGQLHTDGLGGAFQDAPVLGKPFAEKELVTRLEMLAKKPVPSP